MTIAISSVSNNQTFGAWLTTTNRLVELISQNVVTSDSSNGGSITTGNSFVNGHFGAEFVYVSNTLSGGNVSSNGVLRLQANVAFTSGSSNLVVILSNGNVGIGNSAPVTRLHVTGNTRIDGSLSGTLGDFLANATNLTTGTLATARLPATVNVATIVNVGANVSVNTTTVFLTDGSNTTSLSSTQISVGNSTVNTTITAGSVSAANLTTVSNTLTVGTSAFFVANGNVGIGNNAPGVKFAVQSTDAILIPVGTNAQRPAAVTGYIRFNSNTVGFEGYNGSVWGSIGAGATGGGSDKVFLENDITITTNYTITTNKNAGTFGPVTINDGITVTVPTGSRWTVV